MTSWSEAVMCSRLASWTSHCALIRNWSVWSRRPMYSWAHCVFRSLGFGFGTPFGIGCLSFAATHFAYVGGSGMTTVVELWPVLAACCIAPAVSQWSNCDFVMT